jgi:dsRNA-specific ribonuclease
MQILGDVIEGIVGAVLIDSGYDVEACRRIYTEYLVPLFDKYCYGPHEEGRNPKDILYKVMSQRRCTHFQVRRDPINPETNEFEATGKSRLLIMGLPDDLVIIHGQEVEKGSGPWSELAVRRACAQVMKKIKGEPSWIEEVCICKPKSRSETPA